MNGSIPGVSYIRFGYVRRCHVRFDGVSNGRVWWGEARKGKEYKMICKNYMFGDKTCLEDGLPCGPDEAPDDKSQYRNEKYEPFLLPEGYSDLVMKELRG